MCIRDRASPYDAIWGIRLAASSPEAQDPMKWRGQNLLGFALMEVRDELRRVTAVSYTHLDVYKRQILHPPSPPQVVSLSACTTSRI